MSEFPTSQLVASTTLPDRLQLPDVSAYTGKVFGLKTNPHHHQAEKESYEWYASYTIHSDSR
ncbi:hypothetical protein RSAG8_13327, partial [Rhizoctonia solani AG-8 WAC10335]